MIGALLSRGSARGIGFAGMVSVGNEVDLSVGEICAATVDDPGIDGYLLFLESLRKADALRAFALQAAARGKPILAYKLGRSAEARELAVSHMGALAGEDDIAAAFLADCGIARVETLDGLVEGFGLLARVQPASHRERRVGVLTTTAGGATMVVDPLATRGVTIEPPSLRTISRLAAVGIELGRSRLIDLTIAGARYETMKSALEVVTTAPEFDLVLVVVGSSARSNPAASIKPIIDSAGAGKPLAVYLAPEAPQALAALGKACVPAFRTPEACADAIAAALRWRAPRVEVARLRHERGDGRMLDELEAGALLDRLKISRAPAVAIDIDAERAPALPFPFPVAVKVLGAEIAHKSDIGGVVLRVQDDNALLAAIAQIRRAVAASGHGKAVSRVLVQPMISGLGEILIGYRLDREVGPLVMVAAGGIFTEIYRDRSLRLAPVDLATAHEMLGEVRGLKPLMGFRGKPIGDLDAVAHALVAMSRLADDPTIAEAEINPLIVRARGAVAVDALVKLAGKA
jgi:acyl-CoA synthetase (NDP forming)